MKTLNPGNIVSIRGKPYRIIKKLGKEPALKRVWRGVKE